MEGLPDEQEKPSGCFITIINVTTRSRYQQVWNGTGCEA